MNHYPSNQNTQIQEEDSINLREELEKYLVHWKWFLLSIVIAVFGAFIFLKFATPQYSVSSSLLIKDEDSSLSSELSAFQDLGMLGAGQSNIDNEIQILKSRALAETVLKDLNLNIGYFKKENFKESELYGKNLDYNLIALNPAETFKKLDTAIYINFKAEQLLELCNAEQDFVKNIEESKINILMKNGDIVDITTASDQFNIDALSKKVEKYFLCCPKSIL